MGYCFHCITSDQFLLGVRKFVLHVVECKCSRNWCILNSRPILLWPLFPNSAGSFPTPVISLNLEVCIWLLELLQIKTHDILSHKTTNIIAKSSLPLNFLALKSPALCVNNYHPTYSHNKLPGTYICLAVWPCNIKFQDCIWSFLMCSSNHILFAWLCMLLLKTVHSHAKGWK